MSHNLHMSQNKLFSQLFKNVKPILSTSAAQTPGNQPPGILYRNYLVPTTLSMSALVCQDEEDCPPNLITSTEKDQRPPLPSAILALKTVGSLPPTACNPASNRITSPAREIKLSAHHWASEAGELGRACARHRRPRIGFRREAGSRKAIGAELRFLRVPLATQLGFRNRK